MLLCSVYIVGPQGFERGIRQSWGVVVERVHESFWLHDFSWIFICLMSPIVDLLELRKFLIGAFLNFVDSMIVPRNI